MTANGKATLITAIILMCIFFGCKRKSTSEKPVKKTIEQPAKEKPAEYPEEVYGDTELFKKPRFQFILGRLHERELLCSMAMDGTDIRRVISEDILYSDIDGMETSYGAATPTRSPNNRYVALLGAKKGGRLTDFVLLDLKERTSRIIDSRPHTAARFVWSLDSRFLYYSDFLYKEGTMLKYDVNTGKTTELSRCNIRRIWLSKNGKTFTNLKPPNVETVDPNTCRRLKTITVPDSDLFYKGTLSADRNFVFHRTSKIPAPDSRERTWLLTDLRKKIPTSVRVSLGLYVEEAIFGLNNENIYYLDYDRDPGYCLVRLNALTGKEKSTCFQFSLSSITIYNL